MKRSPAQVVRFLVQAAWRRRWLLIIPVLIMLPVGFAASKLMPLNYITHSLLLLQESGDTGPLTREPENVQFITKEERLSALRALLLSERVLGGVLDDLGITDARERATRIRDFRQNTWLEAAGTNFIEIYHSGPSPTGLGNQLKSVISRLLEALVPEQDEPDAIQILLEKHARDLKAARERKTDLDKRQADLSGDASAAQSRLAELRDLAKVNAGKLRDADKVLENTRAAGISDAADVKQLEKEIDRLAVPKGTKGEGAKQALHADEIATLRAALTQRKTALADQKKLVAAIEIEQRKIFDYDQLKAQIAEAERKFAQAQRRLEATQKRLESIPVSGGTGILRAPELIRIIDPPRDPEFPTRSPMIYLLAGLAAGGLIGLFLASVVEFFDTSLRDLDDFIEVAGVPVVTRIGTRGRSAELSDQPESS